MNNETRSRGPGSESCAAHQTTSAVGIVTALADSELAERSDERDQWLRRLAREYCAGYDLGYEHGVEAGRRAVLAEEAQYRRATAALTRNAAAGRPFADLELLRWGPRGRGRFADPRPGDYKGRGDVS